jgi:hypothetical protein
VAIIEDDGQSRLRDMDAHDERELPIADVIPTILRGSRLS